MKTLLGRGIRTERGEAGEGSRRQPAEDMCLGGGVPASPTAWLTRGHLGTGAWLAGDGGAPCRWNYSEGGIPWWFQRTSRESRRWVEGSSTWGKRWASWTQREWGDLILRHPAEAKMTNWSERLLQILSPYLPHGASQRVQIKNQIFIKCLLDARNI